MFYLHPKDSDSKKLNINALNSVRTDHLYKPKDLEK